MISQRTGLDREECLDITTTRPIFIYDATPRFVQTCVFAASRYTGKERDAETGDDYFNARYYESRQGRFMSPDPSGQSYADLNDPQSFNLYSYVRNRPLAYVDPSGLGLCYTVTTYTSSAITAAGTGDNGQPIYTMTLHSETYQECPTDLDMSEQPLSNTLDKSTPNKPGCTAQRIYSGLMGAANLGLAVGKGFALGGAVAGLGATGAGAPAAAVLGVYGTVSIFGQGLAGTAQLYSAFTGNYGTPASVAQVGNILAGPVSGLGTLMMGGSMATAEKRAGYESFATAASSVIDAISAGAKGLPLAVGDHSAAYFGAFANGSNP